MKESFEDILMCPKTGSKLQREGDFLISPEGEKYPVINGIPILIDDNQSLFKKSDFINSKKTFFSNNSLKRAIFHLIPTFVRVNVQDRVRWEYHWFPILIDYCLFPQTSQMRQTDRNSRCSSMPMHNRHTILL